MYQWPAMVYMCVCNCNRTSNITWFLFELRFCILCALFCSFFPLLYFLVFAIQFCFCCNFSVFSVRLRLYLRVIECVSCEVSVCVCCVPLYRAVCCVCASGHETLICKQKETDSMQIPIQTRSTNTRTQTHSHLYWCEDYGCQICVFNIVVLGIFDYFWQI